MSYKIKFLNLEAEIDVKGAYLDYLKYEDDYVIYPKTIFEVNGKEKVRGGSHFCFPLFGDNTKYNLNQHGFAREVEWGVEENEENYLKLRLTPSIKEFEDLVLIAEFLLSENEFTTTLIIKNIGENDIEISPALHPYFKFYNKENIKIDGEKLSYSDIELNDTVFTGDVKSLDTGKYLLEFSQENLPKYAIWSDLLDEYICVEPTFNLRNEEYYNLKAGDREVFKSVIKINKK